VIKITEEKLLSFGQFIAKHRNNQEAFSAFTRREQSGNTFYEQLELNSERREPSKKHEND
jgi:hypothetical protein